MLGAGVEEGPINTGQLSLLREHGELLLQGCISESLVNRDPRTRDSILIFYSHFYHWSLDALGLQMAGGLAGTWRLGVRE